ncbi:hypothetical protein MPSEU_000477000 [Mayamaea pseudoterrestris]|nr:hypothetical protein MPSEU_000477000 [Mayamaea pseudoterrestris]
MNMKMIAHLTRTGMKCGRWNHIARTFASHANHVKVTLYQYEICPFCSKVKTLLDYTNTPYKSVEVNPLTKAEINWSKEYKKVPIATINDKLYFGSNEIVQGLLTTTKPTMDTTEFNGPQARRWQGFANDQLAPLLYPNICGTLKDSYQAFSYIHQHDHFSTVQKIAIQTVGSLAMYMAASRVKKRRGITDERAALETALQTIESDGLAGGSSDFVSGRRDPHLGDLALYGSLRAIAGLPAHGRIITLRDGPLRDWYNRMQAKVEG